MTTNTSRHAVDSKLDSISLILDSESNREMGFFTQLITLLGFEDLLS